MIPISITVGSSATLPALPADMRFVRVLHECELLPERRTTPAKMPEVRPLFPNQFSPFGQSWQMLSWSMNPLLNAGNMTAVYDNHLWIANDHGFSSTTPRANYFTREDLDCEQIRVEALTCGGNILHVLGETTFKTNAGLQACYLVETLKYQDVPYINQLDDMPWLVTTATKLDPYGQPARFPQGQQPNGYQPGVRHPLVADPVKYPQIVIEKWRVVEWNVPFPPDPLKAYLPV